MKKILVTGGPVHGKLDDVKIITNRFKGGLMAKLADDLAMRNCQVTYLTSKGSKLPNLAEVIYHDGFYDYNMKIQLFAHKFDAVILGGAVANLIPVKPFVGKFPSHNYEPGDKISIDFCIAPRVIDTVKEVAPEAHLFGFKLLSGVKHEELIDAAYDIVLESKATAVFANDAKDLQTKYAVTKDRSEHELTIDTCADFILDRMDEKYYFTNIKMESTISVFDMMTMTGIIEERWKMFTKVKDMLFGTVALRLDKKEFLTTGRGKNELTDIVKVRSVNHDKRRVTTELSKATLNAPLLDKIFKGNRKVKFIVHSHKEEENIPTFAYAIPGTDMDSKRRVSTSFNIEGHGSFKLYDRGQNKL